MFPLNCWYVAAQSAELGEKPVARRLLDQRVVLFRTASGKPAALEDRCVHRMLPLSRAILQVSGRTSFELVQKALLAGIPMISAVSAPSSLAIDLARDSRITLCGFVRDAGFNVYAHPNRIRAE